MLGHETRLSCAPGCVRSEKRGDGEGRRRREGGWRGLESLFPFFPVACPSHSEEG